MRGRTLVSIGIRDARWRGPVVDLQLLLSRDQMTLDRLLLLLVSSAPDPNDWDQTVIATRSAFGAYVRGQDQVLGSLATHARSGELGFIAIFRASHVRQDRLLRLLLGATELAQRIRLALELRVALMAHAEHVRLIMLPALREVLARAEYQVLAGQYAIARARVLGMLHSAVPPN